MLLATEITGELGTAKSTNALVVSSGTTPVSQLFASPQSELTAPVQIASVPAGGPVAVSRRSTTDVPEEVLTCQAPPAGGCGKVTEEKAPETDNAVTNVKASPIAGVNPSVTVIVPPSVRAPVTFSTSCWVPAVRPFISIKTELDGSSVTSPMIASVPGDRPGWIEPLN